MKTSRTTQKKSQSQSRTSQNRSGGAAKSRAKKRNRNQTSSLTRNILTICAVVALLVACQTGLQKLIQGNESTEQPSAAAVEPTRAPEPTSAPAETPGSEPTHAPTPTLEATPTPEPTPSPTPEPTPEPEQDAPEISEGEREDVVEASKMQFPDMVISPYSDKYTASTLDANGNFSNELMSWYFMRNSNHQPPTAQNKFDIRQFDAYYLGDIQRKVIYLTFDEGYENGFTGKILDVLKEKNVPAAFFLTKPWIKTQPELARRLVNEGHVAANHTVNHPSMPSKDNETLKHEIEELERYFEEVTGSPMAKFFRPPMGEYSCRTLALTQQMGYKTVFWSFAHKDWEVNNQPSVTQTYNTVMNGLHNGAILLLHAVSESNTKALPDIIDAAREQGFTFESLETLK